jgi:hypothetical protein
MFLRRLLGPGLPLPAVGIPIKMLSECTNHEAR